MEQYQVITRGKLAEGHSQHAVSDRLQSHLKLSEKALSKVFSGKPILIKSQQTWNQAQGVQKKLYRIGLNTELRLQLNSSCLEQGLVYSSPSKNMSSNTDIDTVYNETEQPSSPPLSDHTWLYSRDKTSPLIYTPSGKVHLKSQTGNSSILAVQHSGYWGGLALLLMSVYIALTLQEYFLRWTTSQLNWDTLASILSILLVVLCILILPKLVQKPLLVSFINKKKDTDLTESELILSEEYRYVIAKKRYQLNNAKGVLVGSIEHKSKTVSLFNPSFEKSYSWDNEKGIQQEAIDTLEQLKDNLIDNTAIGSIFNSIIMLKRVPTLFTEKVETENLSFSNKDALPIRDNAGKLVAVVYKTPKAALQVYSQEITSEQLLQLQAMAWVIMGSHWA